MVGREKAQSKFKLRQALALRLAPTYVNKLMVVTLLQVIQHRGVVQVCQVGHILAFLVLGRVHLSHKIFLEIFGLDGRRERKKGNILVRFWFGETLTYMSL